MDRYITKSTIEEFCMLLQYEEKSEATIRKYRHDLLVFLRFVGTQQVTKEIVISYKQFLMEQYLPTSVNSMLAVINRYFTEYGWYDCVVKSIKVGTVDQMAVAYLGWCEGDEDLDVWLSRTCPNMLEQYPFITSIPQDRIVGDRGEVYILVPREADAQVDIHLLAEDNGEVTDTLYESETSEPVLLMCNYSGAYPNARVTIAGGSLTFYPQLGDMGSVVIPINDSLEKLMFDFSDYLEMTQDYYQGMLANGWRLTDEEYLTSTCWNYSEDTPEDCRWVLNIDGDTVQLDLLVDGARVEAQHCEGTWSLNYSDNDGLTYLFLNMLRGDGETVAGEYVVLQCHYDTGILLGSHDGQSQLPVPCEEEATFWWGSVG